MPKTQVVLYQKANGSVPLLDWLDKLPKRAQVKCLARIERLAEEGHALRRPEADYLRNEIYELRIGLQGIHYRILYFFHGRVAAVLSHGVNKERRVPPKQIDTAVRRMNEFQANPEAHTFKDQQP